MIGRYTRKLKLSHLEKSGAEKFPPERGTRELVRLVTREIEQTDRQAGPYVTQSSNRQPLQQPVSEDRPQPQ